MNIHEKIEELKKLEDTCAADTGDVVARRKFTAHLLVAFSPLMDEMERLSESNRIIATNNREDAVEISKLRAEIERLEKENEDLKERNKWLEHDSDSLDIPAAEHIALRDKTIDSLKARETAWCAFKEAVEKIENLLLMKKADYDFGWNAACTDYDNMLEAALALCPDYEKP